MILTLIKKLLIPKIGYQMMFLLDKLLQNFIRIGTLMVVAPDDRRYEYHGSDFPRATVRLHHKSLYYKLFVNPELYFGEAYMDGSLEIVEGGLKDVLDLVMLNRQRLNDNWLQNLLSRFSGLFKFKQQFNCLVNAQKNVAHHYNLSNDFYRLFLDRDLNYSCAYYQDVNDSLTQAQRNKLSHIAKKLHLQPGYKVLDIGCGWGAMAFRLAREYDVEITGVTLSKEQYAWATKRCRELGLEDRVRFELKDYRNLYNTFDRIVSVGMFEHVGAGHFQEFFQKISFLLNEEGVALIHSIGQPDSPGVTQPWLRKYIFPGGYVPSLSEVFKAIEPTGLWTTDVEILRNHYALTLSDWIKKFQINRNKISSLFDDRFCRMWEFYLVSCESAFRFGQHMVFQLQISKQKDILPMTRDYMSSAKATLTSKREFTELEVETI